MAETGAGTDAWRPDGDAGGADADPTAEARHGLGAGGGGPIGSGVGAGGGADGEALVETEPVTIRRAVVADAPALAALHVRAWQWAYRGLLPDAFLAALDATIPRREAWRRDLLAREGDEARCWVAGRAGQIIGFADTTPSHDAGAAPGTAELGTLYLEPAAVGTGLGRRLHAHALDDLRRRGYRQATLWVLATNTRARRFYAIAGWRPDGVTRTETAGQATLAQVRYRIDLSVR